MQTQAWVNFFSALVQDASNAASIGKIIWTNIRVAPQNESFCLQMLRKLRA